MDAFRSILIFRQAVFERRVARGISMICLWMTLSPQSVSRVYVQLSSNLKLCLNQKCKNCESFVNFGGKKQQQTNTFTRCVTLCFTRRYSYCTTADVMAHILHYTQVQSCNINSLKIGHYTVIDCYFFVCFSLSFLPSRSVLICLLTPSAKTVRCHVVSPSIISLTEADPAVREHSVISLTAVIVLSQALIPRKPILSSTLAVLFYFYPISVHVRLQVNMSHRMYPRWHLL